MALSGQWMSMRGKRALQKKYENHATEYFTLFTECFIYALVVEPDHNRDIRYYCVYISTGWLTAISDNLDRLASRSLHNDA
jgi:hypothetical protein